MKGKTGRYKKTDEKCDMLHNSLIQSNTLNIVFTWTQSIGPDNLLFAACVFTFSLPRMPQHVDTPTHLYLETPWSANLPAGSYQYVSVYETKW